MKKFKPMAMIVLLTLCGVILQAQQSKLAQTLEHHVTILASDSLEGRGFALASKSLAIDYIINAFRDAGLQPLGDDYVHAYYYATGMLVYEGQNLVALIEGSDPVLKNEYIVVGAHYDHLGYFYEDGQKVVYNGADDNASGVAGIIEIGRLLQQNRQQLKRSVVLVAFDGEEIGLTGSTAFVKDGVVPPESIRVMFSLDMIGMYERNRGVELKGMPSVEQGAKMAREAARRYEVVVKEMESSIEMRTDTWPFAERGIPAVHVFTGMKSRYHHPLDDSYLLDYEGMEKIARMMARLVEGLAGAPQLIANAPMIRHSVKNLLAAGIMLNAGYNRFNYTEAYYDSKADFAMEAGLALQWKATPYLVFRPAITWDYYGGRLKAERIRVNAVTPQFDLMLTTNNRKTGIPFAFAMIGGYYRLNFSGSYDSNDLMLGEQYVYNEQGIKWGVGSQALNVQIGFYKKYGLNDVIPLDIYPDGDAVNRTTYFGLSVFF